MVRTKGRNNENPLSNHNQRRFTARRGVPAVWCLGFIDTHNDGELWELRSPSSRVAAFEQVCDTDSTIIGYAEKE